jgi:heme-degrading monooxygenase HmoA
VAPTFVDADSARHDFPEAGRRYAADMTVLTRVAAVVDPARTDELIEAYRRLLTEAMPDGLEQTMLLRAEGDEWQVVTLWRDRAALDAMRARPEPPAAVALFGSVDAKPVVTVYDVVVAYPA